MKGLVAVCRFFGLMAFLVTALSACGGGGVGSGGGTSLSPVSTDPILTMAANTEALVPSGAVITSGNVTLTVNGSNNTIYTQVGATVSVPSTATGTPNNTVTTGQPTPGSLSTSPPTITVIAGSPTQNGFSQDGIGTGAVFDFVYTMAFDPVSNSIVVSDEGELRFVTNLATEAGVVTTYNNANLLQACYGVAVDSAGDIFATGYNASDSYLWELPAGTPLKQPWENPQDNPYTGLGLVVDTNGNLYVADAANNRIVMLTQAGVMSVFAGNGTDIDQDGVGTQAGIYSPIDIKIGPLGNFLVLEPFSIREITPQGVVTTVVPVGPVNAIPELSYSAMAVDPSRNVFVAFATSFAAPVYNSLMRISVDGTTLFSNVISGSITALVSDGSGNLYAATYAQGGGAQILEIYF